MRCTGDDAYTNMLDISDRLNKVLRNSNFLVPLKILFANSGLIDNKTLVTSRLLQNCAKLFLCNFLESPGGIINS